MRIARERMADEDHVVARGTDRATLLVGDINALQHTTRTKLEAPFRQLQLKGFRLDDANTRILSFLFHFLPADPLYDPSEYSF